MNPTLALTIASLKMYYRNRQAIFWTLVLPLMFIVIFGLLNFGAFSTVNMGLVDEADTPASEILTELWRGWRTRKVRMRAGLSS